MTTSVESTPTQGIILSRHALFSMPLLRVLSKAEGDNFDKLENVDLSELVEKSQKLVADLHARNYQIILMYDKPEMQESSEDIAYKLKLDGVARNPFHSKQGNFTDIATTFGFQPDNTLYVVSGPMTYKAVKQENLAVAFAQTSQPPHHLLPPTNHKNSIMHCFNWAENDLMNIIAQNEQMKAKSFICDQ